MGRVVYSNPQILTRDWDNSVRPTLEELLALFAGQDVCRMLNRCPTLLSRNVKGTLQRKVEQLAALLPDLDVRVLAERAPSLLSRNMSIIEAHVHTLKALLPDANVSEMVRRVPTLLMANTQKVGYCRCSWEACIAHDMAWHLMETHTHARTRTSPLSSSTAH
jgi:hypothetical protein